MVVKERFQFTPFWKLTMLGFCGWYNWLKGWRYYGPVGLGCDEWRNPSFYVDIPFVGELVVFYGRDFDRSKWWTSGSVNRVVCYHSPDGEWEAFIPGLDLEDIDHSGEWTLTYDEIRVRASSVERVNDYSL